MNSRGKRMTRIIGLVLSCLTIFIVSSCISDETPRVSPEVAAMFVGVWGYTDESNGCESTVGLLEDMTYVWSSNDERITGDYTLRPVSGRDELVFLQINFLVDNVLKDCDDQSVDDAGGGFDVYVNFPDDNTMYWLDRDSVLAGDAIDPGDAALLTLTRQVDQ